MCGILGAPSAGAGRFESALECMRWRGPDSGAIMDLAGYRLGVRRLAITDPDADQPIIHGPTGQAVTLVFNGSLAYPERLRQRLATLGLRPETGNDAELALLAYRAQGVEGVRRLEGPFALALIDEARRELILARDAFGEKPLFYAMASGGGWPSFASTVKALRVLTGEAGSRLPLQDVLAVAAQGWVEWGELTLGMDLKEFPSGTVGIFAPHAAPTFLSLAACESPEEIGGPTLETILLRSVEGRMHGDRPLGLLLSGGLDSACLALLLRRLDRRALCLSLDLEGLPPESDRAALVAQHLDLPHRSLTVGPEILDDLEGLVQKLGVPLADASLLATHRICREAHDEGIGILLSGEGADEIFFGYRRQRAGPWLELARGLLPQPSRRALAGLARSMGRKGWGAGLRFAHALGRSDAAYAGLWSLASPVDLDVLFEGAGRRVDLLGESVSEVAGGDRGDFDDASLVQQELNGYLAYDLCPKLDGASLAAGVEARAPFLDRGIVQRRSRQALGRFESQGKGEIREILSQSLPARLRSGPKRGFGLPLSRWLPRWPRARTLLAETMDLPWNRTVALRMLDELAAGRGAHRAPLLYHLCVLAIHLEDRRQLA